MHHLLGFGRHSNGTADTNHQCQFGLGGDVEASIDLGLVAILDGLFFLGFIFRRSSSSRCFSGSSDDCTEATLAVLYSDSFCVCFFFLFRAAVDSCGFFYYLGQPQQPPPGYGFTRHYCLPTYYYWKLYPDRVGSTHLSPCR